MGKGKSLFNQAPAPKPEKPKKEKPVKIETTTGPAPEVLEPKPKPPAAPLLNVAQFDAELQAAMRLDLKKDIERLCEDMARIGSSHSKLARIAGHTGLSKELAMVSTIGTQLSVKVSTRPYWEKA